MGTEILQSFDHLQDELERARSNLKGLNENIRRIIGREPPDINSRLERVFFICFCIFCAQIQNIINLLINFACKKI